jgi:hypothetical protein
MSNDVSRFRIPRKIVGASLIRVERQRFRPDFEYYDECSRDQDSDGSVELIFDNAVILHLTPDTESMSERVSTGQMSNLGSTYIRRDVGGNPFWTPRVGRVVVAVRTLHAEPQPQDAAPFGVEFVLEGTEPFTIEYINDEQHMIGSE